MAFRPLLHINNLKIGLFIKLHGSWFSHPFATNTFKIKSEKDLTILRGLSKVKILYDPELSDTVIQEESSLQDHFTHSTEENPVTSQEAQTETIDSVVAEIRKETKRQAAFEVRLKQLRRAEQNYEVALKQSRIMFQELRNGRTRAIARATTMISSLGKLIRDKDTSMALMNLMASAEKEQDVFMHSLNVCTLSMMLGHAFDLDEDQLECLGMGAMFHDLGLWESERTYNASSAAFSPKTHLSFKQHPTLGKSMANRVFGTSHPCLEIIEQHHERLDGSGYPKGLTTKDLSLLSKLVMVVDEYDELCNLQDVSRRLTPYEALSFLYAKRREVQWEDAMVVLIQMLTVYPPGSIVELSDGSFGVVSSINPQERMKPKVMLYTPDIPRDHALIIDLSQESALSIVKNLRPREVSKGIRDYLNPRKIISYFPSNPSQATGPDNP